MLIEHESDVNARDTEGHVPLHILTYSEDDDDNVFEVSKLLLENEADPTLQDKDGLTALHWAAINNKEKLVDLLLQSELSNNCDQLSVNASEKRNLTLHIGDKNGLNALHYAVACNPTRI